MSVFSNRIPDGAPVIVVLVEQEGCGACAEYHPIFERVAVPYAQAGVPILRVDASDPDPNAQRFMDTHGVNSTPTVIVATIYRAALGRLEGVASEMDTRRLLDVARVHHQRGYRR